VRELDQEQNRFGGTDPPVRQGSLVSINHELLVLIGERGWRPPDRLSEWPSPCRLGVVKCDLGPEGYKLTRCCALVA